ncbi:MAG TPA: ATP-grasp domain-containing protein [Acholeplasmataceae bacterium]|nr:ATP-grasp domain-containing protein [Acholeplasmataceae bacterium]
MRTIIFIGTQKSGSSREAIRVAEKMGYYTILFTNSHKQLRQRFEYPDVHLMKFCNFERLNELKEMIENLQNTGLKIEAIISFTNNLCYIANKLASELSLNHFTLEGIQNMENKIYSRLSIRDTPYCPNFMILEPKKDYPNINIDFPAVLKAPSSAGSKDVYKIFNIIDLNDRLNLLRKKYPYEPIILEEYLDGNQYLTEVLVIDGKVYIIAIIEQEISYINNHFIVTGYYLIPEKPSYYNKLYRALETIVKQHKLHFGPCHLELRLINGKWKLVEINPRISGGAMNELIELGTGINLVEQTLKLVLNKKIDITPKYKKHVYTKYLTADQKGILEKITGVSKATNSQDVLSIYVKPRKGNILNLPESMGNRYAYVIATGNDRIEAKENAINAIENIKFHLRKE